MRSDAPLESILNEVCAAHQRYLEGLRALHRRSLCEAERHMVTALLLDAELGTPAVSHIRDRGDEILISYYSADLLDAAEETYLT